ncbi:hypothetical protein [Janibacter melonis]|uniref:hypothetical protein n=1 Tax=Janibacter melonis TaxID=262209 RepID=UPI00191AFCBA|nr:hypothetical protein [Janibacter melonis]
MTYEPAPVARLTVQTVDGPLIFDLERAMSRVSTTTSYTIQDEKGRTLSGTADLIGRGLSVRFDGGVLQICVDTESTLEDGSVVTNQFPITSLSPGYWTTYTGGSHTINDYLASPAGM